MDANPGNGSRFSGAGGHKNQSEVPVIRKIDRLLFHKGAGIAVEVSGQRAGLKPEIPGTDAGGLSGHIHRTFPVIREFPLHQIESMRIRQLKPDGKAVTAPGTGFQIFGRSKFFLPADADCDKTILWQSGSGRHLIHRRELQGSPRNVQRIVRRKGSDHNLRAVSPGILQPERTIAAFRQIEPRHTLPTPPRCQLQTPVPQLPPFRGYEFPLQRLLVSPSVFRAETQMLRFCSSHETAAQHCCVQRPEPLRFTRNPVGGKRGRPDLHLIDPAIRLIDAVAVPDEKVMQLRRFLFRRLRNNPQRSAVAGQRLQLSIHIELGAAAAPAECQMVPFAVAQRNSGPERIVFVSAITANHISPAPDLDRTGTDPVSRDIGGDQRPPICAIAVVRSTAVPLRFVPEHDGTGSGQQMSGEGIFQPGARLPARPKRLPLPSGSRPERDSPLFQRNAPSRLPSGCRGTIKPGAEQQNRFRRGGHSADEEKHTPQRTSHGCSSSLMESFEKNARPAAC